MSGRCNSGGGGGCCCNFLTLLYKGFITSIWYVTWDIDMFLQQIHELELETRAISIRFSIFSNGIWIIVDAFIFGAVEKHARLLRRHFKCTVCLTFDYVFISVLLDYKLNADIWNRV